MGPWLVCGGAESHPGCFTLGCPMPTSHVGRHSLMKLAETHRLQKEAK